MSASLEHGKNVDADRTSIDRIVVAGRRLHGDTFVCRRRMLRLAVRSQAGPGRRADRPRSRHIRSARHVGSARDVWLCGHARSPCHLGSPRHRQLRCDPAGSPSGPKWRRAGPATGDRQSVGLHRQTCHHVDRANGLSCPDRSQPAIHADSSNDSGDPAGHFGDADHRVAGDRRASGGLADELPNERWGRRSGNGASGDQRRSPVRASAANSAERPVSILRVDIRNALPEPVHRSPDHLLSTGDDGRSGHRDDRHGPTTLRVDGSAFATDTGVELSDSHPRAVRLPTCRLPTGQLCPRRMSHTDADEQRDRDSAGDDRASRWVFRSRLPRADSVDQPVVPARDFATRFSGTATRFSGATCISGSARISRSADEPTGQRIDPQRRRRLRADATAAVEPASGDSDSNSFSGSAACSPSTTGRAKVGVAGTEGCS